MPAFTATTSAFTATSGAFQDPILNIKIAKKLNAEVEKSAASIKSSASIKTSSSVKTEAPQFFTSPLTSTNMYL
ncbi:UNVERIFIED_CONTAM: hypothetical protein HDU68_008046 [Siphonaria sp. JEL0065]|nr:hypothetical protein HDU68_008046 [Siphonaria sp. JEL0065]